MLQMRIGMAVALCLVVVATLAGRVAVVHAAQDEPVGVDLSDQPVGLAAEDVREVMNEALGGASGCTPRCPVEDQHATTRILQNPVVLGDPVRWQACDFVPYEQLKIVIVAPSGAQVASYTGTALSANGPARCFEDLVPRATFSAFGEFGLYHMSVSGGVTSETLSFALEAPSRPTVLARNGQFELAGFAPHEPTRLLGYRTLTGDRSCLGCLARVGEWSVVTRNDGAQLVRGTGSEVLFAIGARSGDANSAYDEDDPRSRGWVKHAAGRDRGSIVDAVQDTSLYARPGVTGDGAIRVLRGTRMRLDSYPLSNDSGIWWRGMLADGTVGWIRDDMLRSADFTQSHSWETATPLFLADRLIRGPGRDAAPGSWSSGTLYSYTATFLSIPSGAEEWFTLALKASETVTILPDAPDRLDIESGPCGGLRLTLFGPDGQPLAPEGTAVSNLELPASGVYRLRVRLGPAVAVCAATDYDLAAFVRPTLQTDTPVKLGDASNWTSPWGGSVGGALPFVFTTAAPAAGSSESGVTWTLATRTVAGADRSTNWSLYAFIPRHAALNGVNKRDASRASYMWREVGQAWRPLATIDQEASGDTYVSLGTVTNVEGNIEIGLFDNARGDEPAAWVLFSSIRAIARQSIPTLVVGR